MKKILLTLLAACTIANASTNEFDIIKGVDLTGYTNITVSLLNQLVDRARSATNKGMIYVGVSAPDTTNNPRYSNFLWLDIGFTPPKIKVYTLQSNSWNEQTVTNSTVSDGAITTAKLAALAVTDPKIASDAVIERTILNGVVTSNKLAANSVTTDKILSFSVTSTIIATNGVTTPAITDAAVTRAKIATDAVGGGVVSNYGIDVLKIATNAVLGYAISNTVIGTNHFNTNLMNLIPKGWAVVQAGASTLVVGNIVAVTNAAGVEAHIGFNPSWTTTNYVVTLTPSVIGGATGSTNLVLFEKYTNYCIIRCGGASPPSFMTSVFGY